MDQSNKKKCSVRQRLTDEDISQHTSKKTCEIHGKRKIDSEFHSTNIVRKKPQQESYASKNSISKCTSSKIKIVDCYSLYQPDPKLFSNNNEETEKNLFENSEMRTRISEFVAPEVPLVQHDSIFRSSISSTSGIKTKGNAFAKPSIPYPFPKWHTPVLELPFSKGVTCANPSQYRPEYEAFYPVQHPKTTISTSHVLNPPNFGVAYFRVPAPPKPRSFFSDPSPRRQRSNLGQRTPYIHRLKSPNFGQPAYFRVPAPPKPR